MKLFKNSNSKFYRYGFTVRGCRYRGSTQETKSVRALQIASRRLEPISQIPSANAAFRTGFLSDGTYS